MASQFLEMVPRPSAMTAGVTTAFVCTPAAAEADACRAPGVGVQAPTGEGRFSNGILLAQHADGCGCEVVAGFAEGFDQGFGEDFETDHGAATAGGQGLLPEQEARLSQVTNRVLGIRERAIDSRVQGSYDYDGPARQGDKRT